MRITQSDEADEMVARRTISRKALFAAALVEAGMTLPQFASEVGGVSATQLRRVLLDPKQSAPLTAKVDAFIAEHIGRRMTALAS